MDENDFKEVGRVCCFPHACLVGDTMISVGSWCKIAPCRCLQLGVQSRLHQRKLDVALRKYKLRYERKEASGATRVRFVCGGRCRGTRHVCGCSFVV